MYLKKSKKGIWKLTGLFFAGMVMFTILSRAVYQHGTAVVSATKATGGVIIHTVEAAGRIVENQEMAVTTEPGLRVAAVLVSEGQQVSQGEVLFTLDMDYLDAAILEQKQEMEKLKLSIQDGWSQNYASQQRRANAQAQAQENYDSAVSQAETALDRAERNLQRAKEALDAFYNGIDQRKAEEDALIAACTAAESACQTAASALDALKLEIESAVSAAILEAEGSAEEPLPPEDRASIEEAVRAEYGPALSEAETALEEANQARQQAQAELDTFRAAPTEQPKSEEELLAAVEQAQENYDDAAASLDSAEISYGRAIQSASLPESTSHGPQISQISYDQMEGKLNRLEAIREADGAICAPVDGVVTQCALQTGGKTSDVSALLLADLSKGCRFSGLVTQEQSEYIGVGDTVTLRVNSTGKEQKELPVTTMVPQEDEGYRLTVQLEGNSIPLGASVQLSFTRKSSPYNCVVPLSALHVDARNMPYVLVAEPVETVLGTVVQARAVSVTVLEKNESMAALAEGALHKEQQIITSSDRPIDNGSRVRVS